MAVCQLNLDINYWGRLDLAVKAPGQSDLTVKHHWAVRSHCKLPRDGWILPQIPKAGQIRPQNHKWTVRFHCKLPKVEKYQIYDFDFDFDFFVFFVFVWRWRWKRGALTKDWCRCPVRWRRSELATCDIQK